MWRLARIDDDPDIEAMGLAFNLEDPGDEPVPAGHLQATLAALRRDPVRGRAVVLEVGERAEGYALLVSFWSNELGGEVCNVDELYVRPARRGKGHARELLVALAGTSPPWPGRPVAIELEVSPANAGAAALYASLGFRPVRNRHLRLRIRER